VTRAGKRVFDVVFSVVALLLIWPLFLPIALAIRLETPGPIFYRQLRVGRSLHDRTELFHLIKFRTMYQDAEARSGAMWATKNDPRITKVGLFLRKTRLDELPQFLNVILGDMSLVGPRPERPKFIKKLESEIPFYVERTYGLRPGITGFAQINQGYDETIDDVRRKLLFDHAYAAHLSSPLRWLKMDFQIVFGTIAIMVTGRGQ
jgi:lipopolysaccharide/colanic/teichoic acid biosynthesis glycosyltransferase